MTTADSHIGSNRQHRLSDQVPANTHNTRARRKGARDSGPSAAASTAPPAPGVSGEHLILYGSGLPGLGNIVLLIKSDAVARGRKRKDRNNNPAPHGNSPCFASSRISLLPASLAPRSRARRYQNTAISELARSPRRLRRLRKAGSKVSPNFTAARASPAPAARSYKRRAEVTSPVANNQSPRARRAAISAPEKVGTAGCFRATADARVEVVSSAFAAGVVATSGSGLPGAGGMGARLSFACKSEAADVGAGPASKSLCAVPTAGGITAKLRIKDVASVAFVGRFVARALSSVAFSSTECVSKKMPAQAAAPTRTEAR